MKKLLLASATLVFLIKPAMAQEQATAFTSFVNAEGQESGTATLTETPQGVLIELDIQNLPASQWVAFHVHETGNCDHTTGHDSAGGHFNPGSAKHGFLLADGPHAGDMPNQYVAEDGTLRAQILHARVRLAEGAESISGRALMIHGGADDYESQPSGDAGERLMCGVIK